MPRIADLLEEWKKAGCDDKELTRRLIDLFFVSVLLDAGAGDHWKYVEPNRGGSYERSEGIAVASLYMFLEGSYTAKKAGTPLVDGICHLCYLLNSTANNTSGKGLTQLTTEALAKGLQVTDNNPMLGVESRANLLMGLGRSLLAHPNIFGDAGRPGNAVGKHKRSEGSDSSSLMAQIFC